MSNISLIRGANLVKNKTIIGLKFSIVFGSIFCLLVKNKTIIGLKWHQEILDPIL